MLTIRKIRDNLLNFVGCSVNLTPSVVEERVYGAYYSSTLKIVVASRLLAILRGAFDRGLRVFHGIFVLGRLLRR